MVASFQHEGKVCEDQDQLKVERRCCWAEGWRCVSRGQSMRSGRRQWKLRVWK